VSCSHRLSFLALLLPYALQPPWSRVPSRLLLIPAPVPCSGPHSPLCTPPLGFPPAPAADCSHLFRRRLSNRATMFRGLTVLHAPLQSSALAPRLPGRDHQHHRAAWLVADVKISRFPVRKIVAGTSVWTTPGRHLRRV